jgi:hypothetical protein
MAGALAIAKGALGWVIAALLVILDLRLLPAEVRSRVQIVKQIGKAAVIARPDATIKGCD